MIAELEKVIVQCVDCYRVLADPMRRNQMEAWKPRGRRAKRVTVFNRGLLATTPGLCPMCHQERMNKAKEKLNGEGKE